jgi:hypothetical protein
MHRRAAGGEVPHPLRDLSRAVAAEAPPVRLLGRGRVVEGSQARRVCAPTTSEAVGLKAGALRVHGSHLAVDVAAVVGALWRQRVKGDVCLLCS